MNIVLGKKFGYQGKLRAKKGKGRELADILIESATSMNKMPGCFIYLVGLDQDDPDEVWVTEVWNSSEDHANSLKLEHVKMAISRAMPLLDGMPEKGYQIDILGGLGL